MAGTPIYSHNTETRFAQMSTEDRLAEAYRLIDSWREKFLALTATTNAVVLELADCKREMEAVLAAEVKRKARWQEIVGTVSSSVDAAQTDLDKAAAKVSHDFAPIGIRPK